MSGALISADDLAARLGEPNLVVLDIRSAVDGGGRAAYEAGHVPGAIHTDYVTGGWRVKSASGGAGMLPDEVALGALLGNLGIGPDSLVVVVSAGTSAGDLAAASRVVWTLKVAGHDAVRLLDGGMAAWAKAEHALETTIREPKEAGAYPVRLRPDLRATLPEVERAVEIGSAHLVDTRNARSFAGDEKSPAAARAGRIPGAINQDNAAAYDPATGRLKTPDALRAIFDVPDGEVVTVCNTGQQAATNWFVLSEILGRKGVRLYDGSMSEWTADPSRPVATGLD